MVINPLICGASWKEDFNLLGVETIRVSTTFSNICGLLLKTLAGFGGLGMEELVEKVVNMGWDGTIIFQTH
jgi:hypothetical protein